MILNISRVCDSAWKIFLQNFKLGRTITFVHLQLEPKDTSFTHSSGFKFDANSWSSGTSTSVMIFT